ncbi:MAG: dienelactone hydrolase family protein [Acidobacteria bacterium]|nr:dienelactone hydrolase family protein [Acidobacteriota bacterium]
MRIAPLLVAGAVACQFALAADPAKPQAGKGTPYTGAVSEEEFKKLHELKSDKPPALQGQMVSIGEGEAQAYLSLPAKAAAPLPAIVVIHEWWGLNDHIKHWADRLAAAGYAALAVDLYGGKTATTPDDAMAAVKEVDDENALATLKQAHRFLAEDKRVRADKQGVIGWCFGGGWSLQDALHQPDLDAVVMYYGRVVTDPAELKRIKAPLLGVFANQDQSIPPAKVDEFEKALKAAGVSAKILRYDAKHAFANPSNPVYDEKSAAAAWEKVSAFFAKNLR